MYHVALVLNPRGLERTEHYLKKKLWRIISVNSLLPISKENKVKEVHHRDITEMFNE